MTIASDLTASLITLDRLQQIEAEDGRHYSAEILGRVIKNLRDCAERARLVEEGPVPRHWLPQMGHAAAGAPGVVVLSSERDRRRMLAGARL